MTQQPNRQEVGYILLEECEVLIDDRTCRSSTRPYSKNPESGVWYDVDLQSTPEINQGKGASEFPNGSSSDACDLVLRPCANFEAVSDQSINNENQDDSSKCTIMWKSATEILPFNGLLSEMIINSSSILTSSNENSNSQGTDAAASAPKKDYASSQEHESKTNENIANNTSPTSSKTRSDASLLAGLAVEINRQGDLFTRQKDDLHSSSTHDKAGGIIASKGGSIIEGGNLRFLQIENASIMFLEEKPIQESHMNSHFDGEKNEESSSASTLHPCEKLMRMRASFLITFSLPVRGCNNGSLHIDERNNTNNSQTTGENFVSSSKEKAKARIKDTILSSAYQLLGSIIRCDWNHLENRVKNIQQCAVAQRNLDKPASSERASSLLSQNDQYNSPKDGRAIPLRETTSSRPEQQHHSRQSFFPASLSVEELYVRISGASKHFGSEMRENSTHNKLNASTFTNRAGYSPAINTTCDSTFSRMSKTLEEDVVGIFHLPKDVIVTSIATYLRARSLHALRSTNRRMYKALCTVVPGLKLQLFRHQIRSLEWMERRERHCITEAEVIRKREGSNQASPTTADSFLREGEAVCGGDYHRAITGGETILLAPRPNDKGRDKQELLRFDSKTGTAVMMENTEIRTNTSLLNHCSRRAARGGLLCDDPGLGKTVTVISLILRGFGLSTEPKNQPKTSDHNGDELDDDKIFYTYWYSDFLTRHVRTPAILKLITRLLKTDRESGYFLPPINKFLDVCPDYFEVIDNPISLQDIRNKYNRSEGTDFKAFEADVRLCLRNAMDYHAPGDVVHQAAERLIKNFDKIVAEFKQEHVKVALKSLPNITKQFNSSPLIGMLEAKKRIELHEQLEPSSSTLLVVPNPLLQHWEEQILNHIDFQYCTKYSPHRIYYHTSQKKKLARFTKNVSFELHDFVNQERPLIFIDDGSKQLPSPEVLSRFQIVLTSYNRLSAEWKFGSVEQELKASKRGIVSSIYDGPAPEASHLLKVHWLRLIVDEGHVMGKNPNNAIQFAEWIIAQRRWCMTGTPTQQIGSQNGLRNLFYLANFLKHEFFSRQLGREHFWNELINRGWKEGHLSSFFRLKHMISFIMVRHTKSDLIEIPQPTFSIAHISLSKAETTTYNTIASGVRTNIITTSMQGKTSGWQDSLLNPRQSKHASEALRNLRIACCGGLQIMPHIENRHWSETLKLLREVHNLDDVKVQVVNNFIHRAQMGELSSCMCCGIQVQTLFVIPCGDLVCTECINNRTIACPVCEKLFDVDDFQRLQPGLILRWRNNLQEEKNERERKSTLRRVLADLPAQEGNRNDGLNEIDEIEDPTQENRQLRTHTRGESCVYSSCFSDGKCSICRAEHFDCNFMNNKQQCSLCFKVSEECPAYASKAKYVVDKLLQLRNCDLHGMTSASYNVSPHAARLFSKPGFLYSKHRPLKAIAFSQFQSIYEYFGDRLIRRFGGACVADYSYGGTRTEELQKFVHDPNCFVMLLSKQGSHGLDLSFVTHIFFLDTIYDKSLEDQVVARAYRMGAIGSVIVEQLTAEDSIEEVMNTMNAKSAGNGRLDLAEFCENEKEKHAKMHTLLKSTTLIRPDTSRKNKRKPLATDGWHQHAQQKQHGNEDDNMKRPRKIGSVRFKD